MSGQPTPDVQGHTTVAAAMGAMYPVDRHVTNTARATERAKRRDRIVDVDASWQDGVAFIATTGALGSHVRRVECVGSNEAEALGLLFAMELARTQHHRPHALIFRTDAEAITVERSRSRTLGKLVVRIRWHLGHYLQWELQHVHRSAVHTAHALADQARRGHVAAPSWELVS